MQAVVTLPGVADVKGPTVWDDQLFRPVCGVPLLVRVLATAARSGVTSVLIVQPKDLPDFWLRRRLHSPLTSSLSIRMIGVDRPFDPADPAQWSGLAPHLEPKFLWLPWNFVTVKQRLGAIVAAGESGDRGVCILSQGTGSAADARESRAVTSDELATPAVVVKHALLTTYDGRLDQYVRDPALERVSSLQPPGIAVRSEETRRHAERLLVRGSGKASDGLYSNFNRRLCRPAVRWLSNTPVTANVVTLAGLPLGALSGYWYAQGYWSAYVAGALLYFLSVLLDEVDGMLARTRFQESAFGCWLETVVDYASYLFLWIGMSIGLSRQYDSPVWLALGGLTLVMSVMIMMVLVRLRKLGTTPDRPEQFHNRFMAKLESDSANVVSLAIRKLAFLAKKGVMAHYVVLFTVLGLLPLFVGLAAFGSVLTLAIVLYSNRFFRAPVSGAPVASSNSKSCRGDEERHQERR